jgi:flagellar hook-length control protein FliK
MWMVGNQLQQASVHITPRHLGPIDIQVSIQNDQTSVSFLAQNAAVKEALEAAIPRLREMFADSNLQLVNVDVGQRDSGDRASGADLFQQAATGDGNNFSIPGQGGGDDDNAQAQIDPVGTLTSSALVDDYA